jgi:rod shape-determining protein MreD
LREILKFALILIVLIIVQKTLIWLISVTEYGITPDVVLIGVVYMGIIRGRIAGTIAGFVSGLIVDLLSFTFIGLMALSKTVSGFISGFFYNENKTERYLSGYMFVLICFISSAVNNMIYYFIYFQGSGLGFNDLLLRYVLPTSIYTAVVSVFPVIFMMKKKSGR